MGTLQAGFTNRFYQTWLIDMFYLYLYVYTHVCIDFVQVYVVVTLCIFYAWNAGTQGHHRLLRYVPSIPSIYTVPGTYVLTGVR